MMGLRIISALIGIPIFIGLIYLGKAWFALFIFLIILLGTNELKKMLNKTGINIPLFPLIVGNLFFVLAIFFNIQNWTSVGVAANFLLVIFFFVYKYPKINYNMLSANFLALIYVGWTISHLILLRKMTNGFFLILFLFVVIWATDSGAYFSGRFFGKRKLAPEISPKKTIEGAVGGLLISLFCAGIYNYYFFLFPFLQLLAVGAVVSILGQIGDLIESSLKRIAGIKDSGNIIPGHGGILDRFDSTILAAPVFYYLLLLIKMMR